MMAMMFVVGGEGCYADGTSAVAEGDPSVADDGDDFGIAVLKAAVVELK